MVTTTSSLESYHSLRPHDPYFRIHFPLDVVFQLMLVCY